MYRHTSARHVVEGASWPAIERFVSEPETWLPSPAQDLGNGRWRTSVRVGRVRRLVTLDLQSAWTLPDAWVRAVTWTPMAGSGAHEHVAGYLPTFTGRFTLRRGEDAMLVLELEGAYVPPFGRTGAAADLLGLHRAADVTAAELVAEIAAGLGTAAAVPGPA